MTEDSARGREFVTTLWELRRTAERIASSAVPHIEAAIDAAEASFERPRIDRLQGRLKLRFKKAG